MAALKGRGASVHLSYYSALPTCVLPTANHLYNFPDK